MTDHILKLFITSLTLLSAAAVAKAQIVQTVFCRPGTSQQSQAYMWDCIEQAPSFPGGEGALMRYINSERRYPADAYNAGVEGRVRCSFIIDVDGSILDVNVQRGSYESLNREAVRIIRNMPRWNAGTVNGTPVPVMYILTIPFRL